ncbi:MAG: response regulator transcription factor [Desulfovibrio sp.]|jgi:two-component system phosphate regulon response regulator PhoB|nr:response regulator transcription factor [Desulfovibrio sp.]
MKKWTLLIVEDEEDIREMLALHLQQEGFKVMDAANGEQALELARHTLPDCLLLDLMLPGMDGLAVCRELQRDTRTADIPVIMLTARGEEIDRVVGLELGAADYVVKPYSLREVTLRVRSVLRREEKKAPAPAMICGNIHMDSIRHSVRASGQPVELTGTEFRLLEDLMRHKGAVRTREQLLNSVWGYSFEGYGRTVDTHVRRLRGKLGEDSDSIETVRGVGYRARE